MTEPGISVDNVSLSAKLAGMAEAVAGCASTKTAGEQIVRTAADVVDGTAMAGWTVFTHTGLMRTRAYTNTHVVLLDHQLDALADVVEVGALWRRRSGRRRTLRLD